MAPPLSLLLSLVLPFPAPQENTPPPKRPKLQWLAQEEDWSRVDEFEDSDPFDAYKWMALDDDGDWRLNLGGSIRVRGEGFAGFAFDGPAPAQRTDDVYLLSRIRGYADLHHASGFRAYLELVSAHVNDRELPGGTRVIDENQFEPFQAFIEQSVELGAGVASIRIGRQSLQFGRQRLVSPLPWANAWRQWEGAFARYVVDDWRIDGFWSEFVPVDPDQLDEGNDEDLYGIYASRKRAGRTLDLYLLGVDRIDSTFNGTSGDEERLTLGTRYARAPKVGELDWDVEVAYQLGEVGQEDINAYMIGARLGYKFEGERAPRVEAIFEMGSGDSSAGGSVGTFQTPFPLGHAYFGIADAFGRENAIDLGLGAQWQLQKQTKLLGRFHHFLRADSDDFVYNVAGAPIVATGASDGSVIGQEIDLIVTHRFGPHWTLEAGYAHIFTGDVLDDVGLSQDQDFAYLQTRFAF